MAYSSKIINFVLIVLVLPFVLVFTSMFLYKTTYTTGLFNENSHREQYQNSVYKYRIAGSYLLLEIYDKIKDSKLSAFKTWDKRLNLFGTDPEYNLAFYLSYVILTMFFWMLCNLVLYILYFKNKLNNPSGAIISINFLLFIGNFVITPYDLPSYFFILLALALFNSRNNIFNISLIIILATLFRESSALIISSFFAYQYVLKKENIISSFKKSLPLIISFLTVYIGVRIFLGDLIISEGFKANTGFRYIYQILFVISFFGILMMDVSQKFKKLIYIFLILSIPYIFMVFYSGLMVELRLTIPIFLIIVIFKEFRYFNLELKN
jgi:hypothetical protein